MSANAVPNDITLWLESLGVTRRLAALQKNIVMGFVDGLLVADIIAARFPRMVQLHNYCETSSANGRLTNWEILNRKVLCAVDCELGEEDIERISNRQVQRVAIVTFLRLLRTKLDAHAPSYHAEQQAIAAEQKKRAMTMSMQGFDERAQKEAVKQAQRESTLNKEREMEAAAQAAKLGGRRPSMVRSMQILAANESKSSLRALAREMSEEEIESRYEKLAEQVRSHDPNEQYRVNKMAARCKEITEIMAALRSQNMEDLSKLDKRIATLHNQLQVIEKNPDAAQFMDSSNAGLAEETVDETGASSMIGMGRRSSAITSKLLSMIPEGTVVKPNPKMEKEITRRSSVVLKGLKIPDLASMNADSDNMDDDSKFKETGSSIFPFAEGGADEEAKISITEASHRRVYDASRDRHFYVDVDSGGSSWAPPKQGVINCVDEKTGRVFFTNAKTKVSGWNIEEVV
jgi:hypothetical protein